MAKKKDGLPEPNPARRSWEAYVKHKVPDFLNEDAPAGTSDQHTQRAYKYQAHVGSQLAIILDNQDHQNDRLDCIERKLGGNARLGLLDRVTVVEQKVKGAYFLLGLVVTGIAGILWVIIRAGVLGRGAP